jgi:ferredoxin
VGTLRVQADRNVCASSGQCVAAAPLVFRQADTDGTVIVVHSAVTDEEREAVLVAIEFCPTQAIKVLQDNDE